MIEITTQKFPARTPAPSQFRHPTQPQESTQQGCPDTWN